MDSLDKEIMTHCHPEDFIMSDEEVLNVAFDIAQGAVDQGSGLPKEYLDILTENNLRVYSTVLALLENHDNRYWKQ